MEFSCISTTEQMRSVKREEFYKDKTTIGEFHKLFDSVSPKLNHLSFYDKYCRVIDKTGVEVEVWGAIKYISMDNKEPWVDYSYSISTFGNIKSHKQDKELVIKIYPDGYKYIFLSGRYVNIQRAVLSTFGWDIPTETPKHKLTVNHKNKKRGYNRLHNLEWLTNEENIKDAEKASFPIKITVVGGQSGIPVGTIFYLDKRSNVSKYGISPKAFKERMRDSKYPWGLHIEKLDSIGDNKSGLSDELVTHIKGNK